MTLQKFWMDDEEEGCMGCGQIDYAQSKTLGLCIQCNPTDPRYREEDASYVTDFEFQSSSS